MNILQYNDLDITKTPAAFDRVVAALQAGDFRAADVKKLKGTPYSSENRQIPSWRDALCRVRPPIGGHSANGYLFPWT